MWPQAYWSAAKRVAPRRAVVWALVVDETPDVFAYHVERKWGARRTAIYRRDKPGSTVLVTRSRGVPRVVFVGQMDSHNG